MALLSCTANGLSTAVFIVDVFTVFKILTEAARARPTVIILQYTSTVDTDSLHRVPKKLSRFVFVRTSSNFHKFR